MNLLLDTHVLLWWLNDPSRLSKAARKAIGDGGNQIHVSAAVVWEIAIKKAIGKLEAPDDLENVLQANRFQPLPITVRHAMGILVLPDHHRDPFDRILIAQALIEGFKLVTFDPQIAKYPVAILPA